MMRLGRCLAMLAALPLAGCGLGPTLFGGPAKTSLGGASARTTQFGYVVADEPQAAFIGRQIINGGGNAVDAATAAAFAMSVTLPSRAGLGGGGACLIRMPDTDGNARAATVLLFPPGTPASTGGSRPAAVPAMARGLLAMQARYGSIPFSSVIAPAERLAGSSPVSPAFEADLQVVGNALLADPQAAQLFGLNGAVLPEGAPMSQPDLAASLEVLRTQGVQGFYQGRFAEQVADAADAAGGGLTAGDLQASLPNYAAPNTTVAGNTSVAFIPAAATPGAALPASAGLATLDKQGGAVACAFTMNNLFGTGRIAPGTGILLAASPRSGPVPVLGGAIASTPDGNFRAAVTGTGQQAAATAVADGMLAALGRSQAEVPDPGRANTISCPGGVPGGEGSCSAHADPRGLGLAIGGR